MGNWISDSRTEELLCGFKDTIAESRISKVDILNLRQIHEAIYKYLCEDAKVSFNGLFARMKYAHDLYGFEREIITQSNLLRLYCNKIIHEQDASISNEHYYSAFYAIACVIEYVCGITLDNEFYEFLSSNKAAAFVAPERKPNVSFCCVVDTYQLNSEANALELVVTNEDGETCSILMQNEDPTQFPGRQWTQISKALWKYATLNCRDLSIVEGKEYYYRSNPESMIIIEPDFLVDISALAECFSSDGYHPELYIINRLIYESGNENTLQGKAVNDILDELIIAPDQDYDSLFRKCLAANPIPMIALGLDTILNIHKNIKKVHFPTLKDYVSNIKDSEVLLEASYIAPEFGLQGRLDVLTKTRSKYSIVELKSGKAPVNGTWIQNQMQVVGYNMMINSCYGKQNCSGSYILYSQSADNPFRNVVNIRKLEQELMLCRNRVIGILHNLAENPSIFMDWLKDSEQSYSGFINQKVSRIRLLLQNLQDYEYEWLMHQLCHILREIWYAKTGSTGSNNTEIYGFNGLWQKTPELKAQNYEIISSLQAEKVYSDSIHFSYQGDSSITNFRIGDIVILYQMDKRVDKQELIRGRIEMLDEHHLIVGIRGGLKNNRVFHENTLWTIEHDLFESSLYAPLSSVFSFLNSGLTDKRCRPLLMGITKPESLPTEDISDTGYIDQIIDKMEAARDYYIIQGPPGTGKTSGLLSKYIKRQYVQSQKCILILSFTNRAIDEICQNLDKHQVEYIRTGSSATIQERLLSNMIAGKRFSEIEQVIKSNRIWIATVQSCNAIYQDLMKMVEIDEVIVDEASQIIEASILGILSKVPKFILVGDQNQLPPIVIQPGSLYTMKHPTLTTLHYKSFNQSLLERLFACSETNTWNDSRFMLFKHYRMHEDIAHLVMDYYDGLLKAERPEQRLPLIPNPAIQDPKGFVNHRIVWIDTPVASMQRVDPNHVRLVLDILETLEKHGLVDDPKEDIGIIAPFRAMIMAIVTQLPSRFKSITVDTVERYQGSERKIMIISLPLRTSAELRSIESLSGDKSIDRKLNVAVSRAKERLIILGNSSICVASGHYLNLIDKIRHKGIFITQKEI